MTTQSFNSIPRHCFDDRLITIVRQSWRFTKCPYNILVSVQRRFFTKCLFLPISVIKYYICITYQFFIILIDLIQYLFVNFKRFLFSFS